MSDLGVADVAEERVERAAQELYAGGPWGQFVGFADCGVHAYTDAHSMDVYREMARCILSGGVDR